MAFNKSLNKALELLERLSDDNGKNTLQFIATLAGIPLPTAYRLAQTFVHKGYLVQGQRGRYLPGHTLHRLSILSNPACVAAGISRPYLSALAKRFSCLAHFGIFENEMVTYLVCEGSYANAYFTSEGTQLEAYCSAIGKILLTQLTKSEKAHYFESGPFISLTKRTITDVELLNQTLGQIKIQGYAIDDREIFENLFCLAVPIHSKDEIVIGAASLAMANFIPNDREISNRLNALQKAATTIQNRLANV